MKGQKIAALFAAAGGLLLLSACGNQGASSNKQVLNWTENAQLSTQDPTLTTDATSFQAEMNTNEGLYRLDKNQKPQLALAKSVKVTNGGKTYHVVLRKAKWANGDPLTAKDFVYAWRRTVTPSTKSTMAFYLYYLKNAEAINKG
jgi:peptide/nickel transport system substrate-binding protein/oligopeptide transport system substrate-binding protein